MRADDCHRYIIAIKFLKTKINIKNTQANIANITKTYELNPIIKTQIFYKSKEAMESENQYDKLKKPEGFEIMN